MSHLEYTPAVLKAWLLESTKLFRDLHDSAAQFDTIALTGRVLAKTGISTAAKVLASIGDNDNVDIYDLPAVIKAAYPTGIPNPAIGFHSATLQTSLSIQQMANELTNYIEVSQVSTQNCFAGLIVLLYRHLIPANGSLSRRQVTPANTNRLINSAIDAANTIIETAWLHSTRIADGQCKGIWPNFMEDIIRSTCRLGGASNTTKNTTNALANYLNYNNKHTQYIPEIKLLLRYGANLVITNTKGVHKDPVGLAAHLTSDTITELLKNNIAPNIMINQCIESMGFLRNA